MTTSCFHLFKADNLYPRVRIPFAVGAAPKFLEVVTRTDVRTVRNTLDPAVRNADRLQTIHAHVGGLQQQVACPTGHVDARTPVVAVDLDGFAIQPTDKPDVLAKILDVLESINPVTGETVRYFVESASVRPAGVVNDLVISPGLPHHSRPPDRLNGQSSIWSTWSPVASAHHPPFSSAAPVAGGVGTFVCRR